MLSQNLTGVVLNKPYSIRGEDIEAIQRLPNPPLKSLDKEEIFVRRCRLANNQVDSRYGRFRDDDLPRLLEMVQGAPVLVGHDRKSLGVARFFGGSVQEREGVKWVIPSFYWPKAHSKSEDLKVMIDSGVYNEASISFLYSRPTCSICREDLRSCSHWPGRKYENELCFYWYDGIEQVMEGSLVYRGAASGTGLELDDEEISRGETNLLSDIDNILAREIVIKHKGVRYNAILLADGDN